MLGGTSGFFLDNLFGDAAKTVAWLRAPLAREKTKKADVVEHPEVFHHVGLLFNGFPGSAGSPFI